MNFICRRTFTLGIVGLACASRGITSAATQETTWPGRPVRIVAGGSGSVTDLRARWLASRLAQAIGQPVVVENVPTAGGNVAAAQVARSPADGHTILVLHQGIAAINPHVYEKPGYHPLNDLAAVTRFGHGSLVLTVPATSKVQSVSELIALAKSRPGALNYGSPGVGTPPHLASALFARMAGIEAVHLPYRGGGALMTAMLGGDLSWTCEGLTVQLPHIRAGSLRALAVTGNQRSASLPAVPTLAAAGVPGYAFEGWTGFAVPAGTPRGVIERIHQEIARIAGSSEAQAWFEQSGSAAGILTPDDMSRYVRDEYAKWGQFIREIGLRID